ncbi:MAG: hypothetical protein M9905_17570 [Rhizobiaceae bacterium]|nr:hypothetical protein [Rhizobiaceae bacterium]
MKLVRLSPEVAVNPTEVESVTLPERSECVLVTMRTGEKFLIEREWRGTRYEKYDQLLKAIEAAQ